MWKCCYICIFPQVNETPVQRGVSSSQINWLFISNLASTYVKLPTAWDFQRIFLSTAVKRPSKCEALPEKIRKSLLLHLVLIFFTYIWRQIRFLEHFEVISMPHKKAEGIKDEAILFIYKKGTICTQILNASFPTTQRKRGSIVTTWG